MRKLHYKTRLNPFIFSGWAEISQQNRTDGHLTKQGEILLQEFMLKELMAEVDKTKNIEKENERLIKLVNVMKDKFIKLSRKV